MTSPITILIIDDHEVVRKGVRSYLETIPDFQVVGEAGSGEEGIGMVSELIPDIVLLDLIMPGMDGVETTRQIKKISPRTQVVVLTSYHEDVHIFPALKAGAISYILKDMKMEKLVDALHRAYQGEVTLQARQQGLHPSSTLGWRQDGGGRGPRIRIEKRARSSPEGLDLFVVEVENHAHARRKVLPTPTNQISHGFLQA